jgi:hypothetical protein
LNYDIANAKGVFELTEEEQKKKDQNKKGAAEKKKKEKQAEEKEKTDFEAWKKEEKAEYEAWKKEKAKEEASNPKQDPKEDKTQTDATTTTVDDKALQVEQDTPTSPTAAESRPEVIIDLTVRPKDPTEKDHTKEPTAGPNDSSSTEEADPTPSNENALPQSRYPRAPPSVYGQYQRSVYGDEPPRSPVQRTPVKEEPKPWNAVCVLGLRVYSQDSEVSIKLVKPKDVEEGAILDVDGDTPAGATM